MQTLPPYQSHSAERRQVLEADRDRMTVQASLASSRGDQRLAHDLNCRIVKINEQIKSLPAR